MAGEEVDVQLLRNEVRRFLAELQHAGLRLNLFTESLEGADHMLNIAENTCSDLLLFIRTFESRNWAVCPDIIGVLEQLFEIYQGLVERYRERLQWIQDQRVDHSFQSQQEHVRSRGRPRYVVSRTQIEGLSELGFSWSKISRMLGISRMTLYRRRIELGLEVEEGYNQMEDQELDVVVRSILELSPNSGEVMIRGALRGRRVKIQRWRIRESILRVDPLRRERRQRLRIRRRVYRVPGPNSLWHLDGHHKLVRWRMVIHGAIDGFSRSVVYLKCGTNNEATTVMTLFQDAIQRFNVPCRIRCDHGTENIYVARWMLNRYGTAVNPVLTGLSVHNQRIERLWRDIRDAFVLYYKSLFYFMEDQHLLDPLDEVHLYALHYIYLPRVNRSIEEFTLEWNNHPVRTENCRTPSQIWIEGFYQQACSSQQAVRMALDHNIDPENYGTDDNGPVPELQTSNNVQIPRSSVQLTDEERAVLTITIDPLTDDGNHGINLFLQAVQVITHLDSE